MARTTMEFKRGDSNTHTFSIPASQWSAGGTLYFAAKPAVDDDSTNANAVISRSFADGVVTDETIDGVAYKKYTCTFPASDTEDIEMDGAKKKKYLGEFQYVTSGGTPSTFPADDKFINVIVYGDVRIGTA